MSKRRIAEEIVETCRRGWERGLLPGMSGNLSVRLEGDSLLITPSGRPKAGLRPEDLVEMDLEGNVIAGQRPSSEYRMHLEAYRLRPEIGAVVHAHPATATAMSLAGRELSVRGLPEMLMTVGRVPTVPYATPASRDLAAVVGPYLANHDAVVLAHHGVLTLGATLEEAWCLCEMVEHAARTVFCAESLGGANPLSERERILCRIQAIKVSGGQVPEEAAVRRPLRERLELKRLELTDRFLTEKRWRDRRGTAHLIVDDRPLRRVALLELAPGAGYRGGHLHHHKYEGFYVAEGRARVDLLDPVSGETLALELEPGDRLWLPPGVAHRIAALEPLVFVEFTDRPYDPEDDIPQEFPAE